MTILFIKVRTEKAPMKNIGANCSGSKVASRLPPTIIKD